jgi:thiamine pyrophosphokinase
LYEFIDSPSSYLYVYYIEKDFMKKNLYFRYKPDVIKGDMDSIRRDVLDFYINLGTKVIDESHDQDTTDLDKCILYIRHSTLNQETSGVSFFFITEECFLLLFLCNFFTLFLCFSSVSSRFLPLEHLEEDLIMKPVISTSYIDIQIQG